MAISLPHTTSAQDPTTDDLERREACEREDGTVVISNESFRRALKDEAKVALLEDALASARKATGKANMKAGQAAELRSMLRQEREKSDAKERRIGGLEVRIDALRSRPKPWISFAKGAAVGSLVAVGLYLLGRFAL